MNIGRHNVKKDGGIIVYKIRIDMSTDRALLRTLNYEMLITEGQEQSEWKPESNPLDVH